jgi:hypothetical protein
LEGGNVFSPVWGECGQAVQEMARTGREDRLLVARGSVALAEKNSVEVASASSSDANLSHATRRLLALTQAKLSHSTLSLLAKSRAKLSKAGNRRSATAAKRSGPYPLLLGL